MVHPENRIVIAPTTTPFGSTQIRWQVNGTWLEQQGEVTLARWQTLNCVVDGLRQWLKEQGLATDSTLLTDTSDSVAIEMFDLWLAPVWSEIAHRIDATLPCVILVASTEITLLLLPWEVMRAPTDPSFSTSFSTSFSIGRLLTLPQSQPEPDPPEMGPILSAGPLRLLLAVTAPVMAQQNWQADQALSGVLRCLSGLGVELHFEVVSNATTTELRQRIER
ncbi:MAG: hypothetical protein HQL60_09295, partial [Magnetococcales bacterium]|nr:hypothetical protein [Magnetococcales bacterium]